MSDAKQVPLTELLRNVPDDARLRIDDDDGPGAGSSWHPVGRYCNDAAARIAELEEKITHEVRSSLIVEQAHADVRSELYDANAKIAELEAYIRRIEEDRDTPQQIILTLRDDFRECAKRAERAEAELAAMRQQVEHMERVINDATTRAEEAGRPEGELLSNSIAALAAERDALKEAK